MDVPLPRELPSAWHLSSLFAPFAEQQRCFRLLDDSAFLLGLPNTPLYRGALALQALAELWAPADAMEVCAVGCFIRAKVCGASYGAAAAAAAICARLEVPAYRVYVRGGGGAVQVRVGVPGVELLREARDDNDCAEFVEILLSAGEPSCASESAEEGAAVIDVWRTLMRGAMRGAPGLTMCTTRFRWDVRQSSRQSSRQRFVPILLAGQPVYFVEQREEEGEHFVVAATLLLHETEGQAAPRLPLPPPRAGRLCTEAREEAMGVLSLLGRLCCAQLCAHTLRYPQATAVYGALPAHGGFVARALRSAVNDAQVEPLWKSYLMFMLTPFEEKGGTFAHRLARFESTAEFYEYALFYTCGGGGEASPVAPATLLLPQQLFVMYLWRHMLECFYEGEDFVVAACDGAAFCDAAAARNAAGVLVFKLLLQGLPCAGKLWLATQRTLLLGWLATQAARYGGSGGGGWEERMLQYMLRWSKIMRRVYNQGLPFFRVLSV